MPMAVSQMLCARFSALVWEVGEYSSFLQYVWIVRSRVEYSDNRYMYVMDAYRVIPQGSEINLLNKLTNRSTQGISGVNGK